MKCTYYWKGVEYKSYGDLYKAMMGSVEFRSDMIDVLFSEDDPDAAQRRAVSLIDSLKEARKLRRAVSAKDGVEMSPDIETGEDTLTARQLTSLPEFVGNDPGNPAYAMSAEQFEAVVTRKLEVAGWERGRAESYAKSVTGRWDKVCADAAEFHRMINMRHSDDPSEWNDRASKTAFAGSGEMLRDAEQRVFNIVRFANARDKTGEWQGEPVIRQNVHYECELKGLPGRYRRIAGHSDYIGVREDGSLDIYKVVSSVEPIGDWAPEKMEHYRYEMALEKLMLANRGFDVRNARLNIIPVQFVYDNEFENVVEINVPFVATRVDYFGGRSVIDRYERPCSRYIPVGVDEAIILPTAFKEADKVIQLIIPGLKVRAQGTALEAREWVNRNWTRCRPRPRAKGAGYVLTVPETGDVVEVSDTRTKGANEEFVKWVEENIRGGEESRSGLRGAYVLLEEIGDSFRRKGFFDSEKKIPNLPYLRQILNEYFMYRTTEENIDEKTGKKTTDFRYRWKILKNELLTQSNMIAFVNEATGQLDIVCLTQNDPGTMHRMRPERDNLLGYYLKDLNRRNFVMRADWGNIEGVRVMSVVNQLSKELAGRYKLGKLKVVCTNERASQKGRNFSFADLSKDWDTIVDVVNEGTGGKAGLVNRVRAERMSFITVEEAFTQLLKDVIEFGGGLFDVTDIKSVRSRVTGYTNPLGEFVPGLLGTKDNAAKMEMVNGIVRELKRIIESKTALKVRDAKALVKAAQNPRGMEGMLASLYIAASDMMRVYSGSVVAHTGDIKAIEGILQRPEVLAEGSVERCVNLVQTTIGVLNDRFNEEFESSAKRIIDRYKSECGYGKARNVVLGDQSVIYRNLFIMDENGENTLMLKNPYDMTEDLLPREREFLKGIAYEFYKVTCRMRGERPSIAGPEDRALYERLPEGYLDLPLQRASKVSRRSNLKSWMSRAGEAVVGAVRHPLETLKRFVSSITDMGSVRVTDSAFENMTVYNRYKEYVDNPTDRMNHIAEKGADWFETNIENVFIDYLYAQTRCEEMNRLLTKINAIEIALRIRGLERNDDKEIDRICEQIDKYTKVNVHGGTIMEDQSVMLDRGVRGLRKLVTEVFFGFNLYGWVRDHMTGLLGNFTSAALKFNTNISVANLAKAHKYVWEDSLKEMASLGLLRKLNMKYGFSSFDFGNLAGKRKSEGGFIFDWSKMMYWTMKEPDYLNRMTLFVARMMEDGSLKAYGLDADGNLKYDWRKDARFSLIAKDDGSDPRFFEKLSDADKATYNRQKGAYYDLMDELNKERPGRRLKPGDDLPDGYSIKTIRSIKRLGEQLYGAYDKASRNMLEHMAIGRNFVAFFNFLNGITDTYFGRTRVTSKAVEPRQKRDEEGYLLYRNTETGEETREDTGTPVMENADTMTEGIFASLQTAFKYLTNNNWDFKGYYDEYVKDDAVVRSNYRKLCLDLSVSAIFGLLFTMLIKPAYKRRKEEMDPEALVQNICIELLYRGWARSADYYSGPLALLKYFGDSTNPVAYDMGYKMVQDVYNLMAGENTFGETALSYSAFYRSMQDSLKAYYRDMAQQNGTAAEEEARKREKEQRKGKTGTVM